MNLMTSNDDSAYETAILHAYGETITPSRSGKRGSPKAPRKVASAELNYAVVTKRREKGRAVEIGTKVVFGTEASILMALGHSKVSRAINTAFIERENGTGRHRKARKARKTYRFSKDWWYHDAVTCLSLYSYNFCRPVRTLVTRGADGNRQRRSPPMAAGLTDRLWSMSE